MNRSRSAWLAAAIGLAATVLRTGATGDESRMRLARDAESDLVRARCAICHSLDYIPMNSPFMTRTGWEAEVRKMIKVMGAPIAEGEVAPIVDYLAAHYGAE
jgi:hypothetical protein